MDENHALQTLMKRYEPEALKMLGYTAEPKLRLGAVIASATVRIGEHFEWRCTLHSEAKQKLAVTLRIHFSKANGSYSAKVFAVRDPHFEPGEQLDIHKHHAFRPKTTRVLYPGEHRAELVVNGHVLAQRNFILNA